MAKHVISKLANSQLYTAYANSENNQNKILHQVHVRGGAGVAEAPHIQTPDGVYTTVSDEDAAFLESLPPAHAFQVHKKRGLVKILDTATTIEKDTAQLEGGPDASAPLRAEDFSEMERIDDDNATGESGVHSVGRVPSRKR